MRQFVYDARAKEYGGDWGTAIKSFPLAMTGGTVAPERLFLQCDLTFVNGNKLERIIGWSHPDLKEFVKSMKAPLFCDATFYITPKEFSQCLVLMSYDKGSKTYFPWMYILMQSKTKLAYWHAFNQAIIACDWELEVSTFTCDYEHNLIDGLKEAFSEDAELVGCLFHFIQCQMKKLKDRGIPMEIIMKLLGAEGLFKLLTVISVDEIVSKGFSYYYYFC